MFEERFEKRLIFFAGKGGVGKTCLSAAIGLAHARRGRRTLLVELGATPKIPSMFGREAQSSYTPIQLSDELPLYTCHVTPGDSLTEYGLLKLRMPGLYRAVFENDFMRRLLDLVPGMDELLLIGKIWFLEQERRRDGSPVFDRLVVDAPATGHGLGLLQLPSVIVDVVHSGTFATEMQPILEMLRDRGRTVVHLVSLPEELPVRETLELAARIRGDLGMALGCCFMNKMWPGVLTGHETELFGRFHAGVRGRHPGLDELLDRLRSALQRHELQRGHLRRLTDGLGDVPVVEVPYLFVDRIGLDQLEVLAHPMGKEWPG